VEPFAKGLALAVDINCRAFWGQCRGRCGAVVGSPEGLPEPIDAGNCQTLTVKGASLVVTGHAEAESGSISDYGTTSCFGLSITR
jgi:hypothetical protein